MAQPAQIEEGQVWTFMDAPVPAARVVIQKIEAWPAGGDTVHVSVYGLLAIPGRFIGEISHMPFSRSAIEGSLERLTDDASPDGLDIADGYAHWKDAKGGVFTISVAEASKFVIDTALGGRIVE